MRRSSMVAAREGAHVLTTKATALERWLLMHDAACEAAGILKDCAAVICEPDRPVEDDE
jgi:hypothetical protein